MIVKKCKYCKKDIPKNKRNNIYCSFDCSVKDKIDNRVNKWKEDPNIYNNQYQISAVIRNYLIEKAQNKCEICGWNKRNPITNKVPLEIHHIDGNRNNNKEENLQVLCPNCHSLTENFKALNINNENTKSFEKNICIDCGQEINKYSQRCVKCANKAKMTQNPIERNELKKLIRNVPFTTIGKNYNVSNTTIRKWCKLYKLPYRKKDIMLYSDEEWSFI